VGLWAHSQPDYSHLIWPPGTSVSKASRHLVAEQVRGFEPANLGFGGKHATVRLSGSNIQTARYFLNLPSVCRCNALFDWLVTGCPKRVIGSPASFSRGPEFKYLPSDRVSWLRFFVIFLSSSRNNRDSTLHQATVASFHILSSYLLIILSFHAVYSELLTNKIYWSWGSNSMCDSSTRLTARSQVLILCNGCL
jgi:hypothetical protein